MIITPYIIQEKRGFARNYLVFTISKPKSVQPATGTP
jgi:hypothetical protein